MLCSSIELLIPILLTSAAGMWLSYKCNLEQKVNTGISNYKYKGHKEHIKVWGVQAL